jgi:hypothetical protein
MIKIHALDGYKYLRYEQRNLTYICLEMSDFNEDIKSFVFLNTYHTFDYGDILMKLRDFINSKGQLPKTHIVYREEPSENEGETEVSILVSKKMPFGILEYIKAEKERVENREVDDDYFFNVLFPIPKETKKLKK